MDVFSFSPAKHHGCVCPFHPYQIISYILFTILTFTFYFIVLPFFSDSIVIMCVLGFVFTLLLLTVAIITLMVTLIDPTDKQGNKSSIRLQNR